MFNKVILDGEVFSLEFTDKKTLEVKKQIHIPAWAQKNASSLITGERILNSSALSEFLRTVDMTQKRVLLYAGQDFESSVDLTINFLNANKNDNPLVLKGLPSVLYEFDRKVIGGVSGNDVLAYTKENNQPILDIKSRQNLPTDLIEKLEKNKFFNIDDNKKFKIDGIEGSVYRNWHINGVRVKHSGVVEDIQTFNQDLIVPTAYEVVGISEESLRQFKLLVKDARLLIVMGKTDKDATQTISVIYEYFKQGKKDDAILIDQSLFDHISTSDYYRNDSLFRHWVDNIVKYFDFNDMATKDLLTKIDTWRR